MKSKFILCFIIIFMLISCTSFDITTEIEPKVTIIGRNIGLVYKLGDIIVSDTLTRVDRDIIDFLQKEKNPIYTLHIEYSESENCKPDFNYYINGIFVKKNEDTVDEKILLSNMDKIKGFHLYELDGKTFEEKNKEVIKEKLEKIKKKVEEEKKDKYLTEENKW